MNREEQIESVVAAHRAVDVRGHLRSAPEWHDLDDNDRLLATEEARRQRLLEASLDPAGLSSTGHAVLNRTRRRGKAGREEQ